MSESASSSYKHIFFNNHSSSQLDPNFISMYIESEQTTGHYSEAFLPEDLESLIGPFRTSPLVPKPHSDTFQMIQDMSYPQSNLAAPSVNAGINSDDFPTTWGSFSQVTELILLLPPGCLATTFDISAVYCITPIRPNQQHHLCISWKGLVYVN